MPTYLPPVTDDVPTVLSSDQYPPQERITYRLFGHFRRNNRGRTVILKVDNTCVVVDHPIDIPVQGTWDQESFGGVATAQIQRVFRGGHVHHITAAEESALGTCGAGGTVTQTTWGSLASGSWGDLQGLTWGQV